MEISRSKILVFMAVSLVISIGGSVATYLIIEKIKANKLANQSKSVSQPAATTTTVVPSQSESTTQTTA